MVFYLSVSSSPQICTLLKCLSTNLSTCGQPVETAQTKFEMFSLSGTFGTSYVFPEVLYSGVQLAPGEFEVMGHPCDLSDISGQKATTRHRSNLVVISVLCPLP